MTVPHRGYSILQKCFDIFTLWISFPIEHSSTDRQTGKGTNITDKRKSQVVEITRLTSVKSVTDSYSESETDSVESSIIIIIVVVDYDYKT